MSKINSQKKPVYFRKQAFLLFMKPKNYLMGCAASIVNSTSAVPSISIP